MVLVIYVVLAGLFGSRLALWEAPDEPAHYAAALQRAGVATPQHNEAVATLSAPDPPLFPLVAAVALVVGKPDGMPGVRPNPQFLVTHQGGIYEEAMVHGQDELPPWSADVAAVHHVRWLATVLGAFAVIASYGLGRLLFDGWLPAVALAGSVAWLPAIVFTTATVEPLSLAIAGGAWTLFAAVRTVLQPAHPGWMLLCGTAAGLSALAAPAGLVLTMPLIAATIWVGVRPAVSPRQRMAALCGPVAWLATGGWWYLRQAPNGFLAWLLPGTDAAIARTLNAEAARLQPPVIGAHPLVQTFVGRFGWETTRAPGWTYDLVTLVLLCALIGLVGTLYVRLSPHRRPPRPTVAVWAVLTLTCLASFLLVVGPASQHPEMLAVDGRPMLVVIPAWLAVVIAGLCSFWGQRLKSSAFIIAPAALVLSILTLPDLRTAHYHHDPIWAQPSVTRMTRSGAATFAVKTVLFGYRLDRGTVRPGETVHIFLYWRSPSPPPNFQTFVHIASADGRPIAQKDQEPGHGWYPPAQWQPEDVVEDDHELFVPPGTAPGSYSIIAGAYDLRTVQRYPVTDSTWPVVASAVVVGNVKVAP